MSNQSPCKGVASRVENPGKFAMNGCYAIRLPIKIDDVNVIDLQLPCVTTRAKCNASLPGQQNATFHK
jgi:hypothetical protein